MYRKLCAAVLSWSLASSFLLSAASPAAQARTGRKLKPDADLTQYVNPFVGTGRSPLPDLLGGNAGGNTFPGATLPFGMVQWSPDTENGFGPEDRGSYQYADTRLRGFSLTHLSGPGCHVFADVPFMPLAGGIEESPAEEPNAYLAGFSHEHEGASPRCHRSKTRRADARMKSCS